MLVGPENDASFHDVKAPPVGLSTNALPRSISASGRLSSMSNLQLADGDSTAIEFFLASDASAIIEHTKVRVVLMPCVLRAFVRV